MPTTLFFRLPQTTGADIPLILNADDFGLTRGINRAIAELHRAGALTSATLMATGPAFDDAVDLAHAQPALGIGCHVVLVDGVPASDPARIPTLIGPDGHTFRRSLAGFLRDFLLGKVRAEEITLEATAQITRLQQGGIAVTHLDTHKHTHILPGVARALLIAAERTGVHAIRNPFEPAWSLGIGHAPALRRLQVGAVSRLRPRFLALPQIRSGTVRTTDGTIGISATASLDGPTLQALVASAPPGVWELVCHPGYNDSDLDKITTRLRASREVERFALLSVFSGPTRQQLVQYADL